MTRITKDNCKIVEIPCKGEHFIHEYKIQIITKSGIFHSDFFFSLEDAQIHRDVILEDES